jgi:diguanylate cyclase (GGDEF)-like protein/PAS domain S-box-containing protein
MDRGKGKEYDQFQKDALQLVGRILTTASLLGFLFNSLWFFWDSFEKILFQESVLLLGYTLCRFFKYLGEKKHLTLFAIRGYVSFGALVGVYFTYSSGNRYLFTGVFLLTLCVLIAIFTLSRRESFFWLIGIFFAGYLSLYFRYLFPPLGAFLSGMELIQIAIFLSIMSGLLILFGYRLNLVVEGYVGRINGTSDELKSLYRRETALREKYETVFSLIPDLLFLVDFEGRLLDANPAFFSFTGDDRDKIIGEPISRFLNVDDPELLQRNGKVLKEGKSVKGMEIKVNRTGDEPVFFEINASPVYEDGQVVRTLNMARDITEKKVMMDLLHKRSEELYLLSITDSLTGMNNRMKLDNYLSGEFNASFRYGTIFSIILVDLDFFKSINDTYGHSVGDEALKNVAQIFIENVRETDYSGRWGGEEFMIICPRTNGDDAFVLAEKLRELVSGIPCVGKVTASFGVTEFCIDDDLKTLLVRVDKALYEAKKTGRNRSVLL